LNNPLRITDPTGAWHLDDDGNVIGDYDGEYIEDLNLIWVEDGQYWENGADLSALDVEESRHPICLNGECFYSDMPQFEPDVPGGVLIKQGAKQAVKRLGPPAGNFLKRYAGKAWNAIKKGLGFANKTPYKTADDVINAATNETLIHSNRIIQKELKGDINEIFDNLADEASATIHTTSKGIKWFKVGDTRVQYRPTSSKGDPTLDISQGGKLFAIRINP